MSIRRGVEYAKSFFTVSPKEKDSAKLELARTRVRNTIREAAKFYGEPSASIKADVEHAKAELAHLLGKPVESLTEEDWENEVATGPGVLT